MTMKTYLLFATWFSVWLAVGAGGFIAHHAYQIDGFNWRALLALVICMQGMWVAALFAREYAKS